MNVCKAIVMTKMKKVHKPYQEHIVQVCVSNGRYHGGYPITIMNIKSMLLHL
jgi:hypothetical protein